jgi:hypothetical protein
MISPQGVRDLINLPLSSDETALLRKTVENNNREFEESAVH